MKHHATRLSLFALVSLTGCYGAEDEDVSASQASLDPQPPNLDPCALLPHLPDVALDSLSVVSQGGVAHMIVTLRNRGCAASPPIGAIFSVTLIGGVSQIGTWTPNSSYGTPANGIPRNATQTFDWPLGLSLAAVQGLGGHWHLVIDPNNTIAELSESNNTINQNNP